MLLLLVMSTSSVHKNVPAPSALCILCPPHLHHLHFNHFNHWPAVCALQTSCAPQTSWESWSGVYTRGRRDDTAAYTSVSERGDESLINLLLHVCSILLCLYSWCRAAAHFVLFFPSMCDHITTEVNLTGVTPALADRTTPPGGQHSSSHDVVASIRPHLHGSSWNIKLHTGSDWSAVSRTALDLFGPNPWKLSLQITQVSKGSNVIFWFTSAFIILLS